MQSEKRAPHSRQHHSLTACALACPPDLVQRGRIAQAFACRTQRLRLVQQIAKITSLNNLRSGVHSAPLLYALHRIRPRPPACRRAHESTVCRKTRTLLPSPNSLLPIPYSLLPTPWSLPLEFPYEPR